MAGRLFRSSDRSLNSDPYDPFEFAWLGTESDRANVCSDWVCGDRLSEWFFAGC